MMKILKFIISKGFGFLGGMMLALCFVSITEDEPFKVIFLTGFYGITLIMAHLYYNLINTNWKNK